MRKRITVEQLTFGMYVAALDRPWTDTPFVFQGFVLRTHAQLRTLRKYCQSVEIDTERGADAPAVLEALKGEAAYAISTSVEHELPQATAASGSVMGAVEELLRAARLRVVMDGRILTEAVGHVVDSVLRNPDALILVARLGAPGGRLQTRAINSAIYMGAFGRHLQRSRPEIERMVLVGLLQDVGKARLPEALLDRHAPITREETLIARSHVAHTAELLRAVPSLPREIAELAVLHHERLDGSGYPKGLRGAQIGVIGAAAAIVDVFDAMTQPRPYPQQRTVTEAYGALRKGRGTLFHDGLVEEFVKCFGVFPVGSLVELNSGEIAFVLGQHPEKRLKPRVAVVADAQGHRLATHKLLDLSRAPRISQDEVYLIRRTLLHGAVPVDLRDFRLA